ncbi:MAG: hypothetical protein HY900_36105, partial [Deltaproteobacteria bacterium]|nr:hypothetical protein [Deltaproteobacteria bacterium]
MSFSKADQIVVMAKAGGVAKDKAEAMLDALVVGIADAVASGDRAVVTGL